jgi:hypothetical protein
MSPGEMQRRVDHLPPFLAGLACGVLFTAGCAVLVALML